MVPRELWRKAGAQGLLGMTMPEEYGGAGADFLYSAILIEEQGRALASGPAFSLHNDIVVPYLLHYGTEEQKKKWIPKACSGDLVTAIAMTEPGTGSDLQSVKTTAVMDGNHWVINGSKTFISNGQLADLVIVVAKTDPKLGAKGTSLIAVETRHAGLQARPQSREDRHEGPGHLGAVLRQCPRAGRSSAGRPGHGLRPAHAAAAAGAPGHRHPGHCRDRGGDGAHHRLRQGTQGVRQADHRFPEHPLQACGTARPRSMSPGYSSTIASRAISRASSTSPPPPWPSTGPPTCSARSSTSACSSTAATATCGNTPSPASTPTHACRSIYGGTNEIMKELIGRTL